MALYPVQAGLSLPQASDINQFVNVLNGNHDVGPINLAPSLSAPTSESFPLTAQSGGILGVGPYNYKITSVTGQYKTDGVTLVQTGETLPSNALLITTTSGNTTVKINLPTTGLPASQIAFNIYRTSVNGSDYKLIATVKVGNASYIDNTADASRGTQTPPTTNTTGTVLTQYVRANARLDIEAGMFFTNGGSNSATANITWGTAFASPPHVMPLEITSVVSYGDVIYYPYIYNVTTTGCSVKLTSVGNLGSSTPANLAMWFMAIGN